MKTRKNIYLWLGIILIVLNLLVDITAPGTMLKADGDGSFNVGYLIGYNFLIIIGLVFLRLAFKLQRKIKMQEQRKMIDTLGEMEKDTD